MTTNYNLQAERSRQALHLPGWRKADEGSKASQQREQGFGQRDLGCQELLL